MVDMNVLYQASKYEDTICSGPPGPLTLRPSLPPLPWSFLCLGCRDGVTDVPFIGGHSTVTCFLHVDQLYFSAVTPPAKRNLVDKR